jgi:hypothetical protein
MHNWILVVTIFPRNDKDFFVQRPAGCDADPCLQLDGFGIEATDTVDAGETGQPL